MPIELKDTDSVSDVEVSNEEEAVKKADAASDVTKETTPKDTTKSDTPEASGKETGKEATAATASDNEDRPPLPTRRTTSATDVEKPQPQKVAEENPILKQLKEAFPGSEEKYIKMAIIASQGNVDSAFNALLYLSDPESSKDIELPTYPVHGDSSAGSASRRQQLQLQQDEMLARRLNEEYNRRGSRHRYHHNEHDDNNHPRSRHAQGRYRSGGYNDNNYNDDDDDEDGWTQFVERDLPEMTAKANKSIQETASKVSNWFSNVTKNFMNEGDATAPSGKNDAKVASSTRSAGAGNKFNSFGARVGEESLESHGISLNDNDLSDDEDVPPQLPSREKPGKEKSRSKGSTTAAGAAADPNASVITEDDSQVVPQTTYIDTPDTETKKKWPSVAALDTTPTKKNNPSSSATKKAAEGLEDDLLIDSDDDL